MFKFGFLLLAAMATLVSSVTLPENARDGLYFHIEGEHDNDTLILHTAIEAFPKPDLKSLRRRSGAITTRGTNPFPSSAHAGSDSSTLASFYNMEYAQMALTSFCMYGAYLPARSKYVFKYGNEVAYVCNYASGSYGSCDANEIIWAFNTIYTQVTSGWFYIPDWDKTYGYQDSGTKSICGNNNNAWNVANDGCVGDSKC